MEKFYAFEQLNLKLCVENCKQVVFCLMISQNEVIFSENFPRCWGKGSESNILRSNISVFLILFLINTVAAVGKTYNKSKTNL